MLTMDAATRTAVSTATDKTDYAVKLNNSLSGAKTIEAARNGTIFRQASIVGSFTAANDKLTIGGVNLASSTIALAADLTTGTSTLTIRAGAKWVSGSLGLTGSGCDFILPKNPTANNGFLPAITMAIVGPTSLPPMPDTTPPVVSLAVSTNNMTSSGNLVLSATATDNKGISKVEFYRGGVLIGTSTTGVANVYTYSDALAYADNGTKSYFARAYDTSNNTTDSNVQVVNVSIPNPNPTAVFTTTTVKETSGSIAPINHIPPMFGFWFNKGDVPAGYWPKFELADTTNVPYTVINPTYWSDGSFKGGGFLIRVPSTIAANGSLALNVRAINSGPTASARTLAEVAAGSDINMTVVGLDNLSGTWISSLNQGITDNDDVVLYGDGPVGKVYRIRQQYMQSGANHGQLECYWYVAVLQDAAGGLYGVRFLGETTQPWYDVDTPTKTYRSFSSVLLKNGGTTVRDCWANHLTAKSFSHAAKSSFTASISGTTMTVTGLTGTISNDEMITGPGIAVGTKVTLVIGGGQYAVNNSQTVVGATGCASYSRWIDSTANGFEAGILLRATGTTLPAQMSAGVSYFGTYINANQLYISTTAGGSQNNTNLLDLTGVASGDCTIQGYPYVTHFGKFASAGATGKYDYAQCGGSVATDATVRMIMNVKYLIKSGAVGPYDTSLTPTQQTGYSYEINSMGPVLRANPTTGERPDIGVLPTWQALAILKQSATDEQTMRMMGLAMGQVASNLLNSTTKTIPNGTGGTYSGMPAGNTNFRYDSDPLHNAGFTNPSGNAILTGLGNLAFDHMPSLAYYPYILTGEPQYLDTIINMGSLALLHRYPVQGTATTTSIGGSRNMIVNGTTYQGATIGDGYAIREDAWSTRDVGMAASVLPANYPVCAAYKTYFNDILNNTFASMENFRNNVAPTFYKTSGLTHFATSSTLADLASPWMTGYFMMQNAFLAKWSENANASANLNNMVKWFALVFNTYGGFVLPAYRHIVKQGSNPTAAYITDITQFAIYAVKVSWASGNANFTLNSPGNGYTPIVGDVFIWEDGENGSLAAPGGFALFTKYFVVSASGLVVTLSDTAGGAPIVPTNTVSPGNAIYTFYHTTGGPSNGSADGIFSTTGYLSNLTCAFNWSKAAGISVDAGMLTDMNGRVTANSINYNSDPKYKVQATYNQ